MSIQLTNEQLAAAGQAPLRVTDPDTKQVYVLLRADVFDAILAPADDIDMREVALLVDRAMAEDDANDPHLESYQQYQKLP